MNSPPRINLFFAVLPPDPIRSVMEMLGRTVRKAHGLRGRLITTECLHNTLAAVQDPRQPLCKTIERAKLVGDRIKYPSFSARYELTGSFDVHRNRYPLVLRGDAGLKSLLDFRQAIGAEMTRAGFPVASSYTPHVTLLWADRPIADYPIAPIMWMVTDFVLVASEVGKSRHIQVARWPLK